MSKATILDTGVASYSSSGLSCGVATLENLFAIGTRSDKNAKQLLLQIYKSYARGQLSNRAYYIFSDYDQGGHGANFAKIIANIPEEYNCSNVYEIGPKTNPNSGNQIRVWVWDFNKEGFLKFVKEHLLSTEEELV